MKKFRILSKVRSGQLWISQANIIELSGLPKEQLLSLNNYLLAEKIELFHEGIVNVRLAISASGSNCGRLRIEGIETEDSFLNIGLA